MLNYEMRLTHFSCDLFLNAEQNRKGAGCQPKGGKIFERPTKRAKYTHTRLHKKKGKRQRRNPTGS